MEPDRNLGLRPLLRGPTLLATLTLAALAAWRGLPAPGARSFPSPAGGPGAAPGLLLAPREADLGCVEPGSRHEVALAWRREGPGPLKVLAVETGCGCLGLTGLPLVLPEAAEGSALLVLKAGPDPGPLETHARLVLGGPPPHDVLTVRLRAYVGRALVVRPMTVDLGRRSPGSRTTSRLSVLLPPGTDAADLTFRLASWPGEARACPSLLAGRHGPDLVLDTTLPTSPGPLTGALLVRSSSAGEAVVPLRAEVVPARAVLPAASGAIVSGR